ncbi:SANT/Myb-like DNA-binding domain-containing protein [Bradyrhizobium sp. S69]|uniref:SANT/Myb-like DNA-binding domain-containing protein n=1 Tax=Bradyrhizobium sp. S69 TaxID=1641856 RepID=UPI001AEE923E|nr:SANT/Myb-like DNA-binding domain-containing protein [Bradyrhizobium sp. S69]
MAEKNAKTWTNEEDERLRELVVSEAEFADIAKSLGRTEKAVKARAYILRLSLRRIGVRRRGLSRWG